MITIILLLLLLDIQRPPIPETVDNRFVVTELVEESLTGCAPSYQSGGAQNQMISVDQHAAGPQFELPLDCDNPLPMVVGVGERNNVERFIGAEGSCDETSGFPDPTTPAPVAVVPEPPTAAILGISAVALLYLIFGRKQRKLYRRS